MEQFTDVGPVGDVLTEKTLKDALVRLTTSPLQIAAFAEGFERGRLREVGPESVMDRHLTPIGPLEWDDYERRLDHLKDQGLEMDLLGPPRPFFVQEIPAADVVWGGAKVDQVIVDAPMLWPEKFEDWWGGCDQAADELESQA